MAMKVYDTAARGLRDLETRTPGRVAMYCCGPTVYNYIHIGNARTFVWFDMIRRYLVYRGYDVTYVMNYTDVDDKIIERANLEGVTPDGITKKYADAFEADMGAFGARPADLVVRATDHIGDMVEAIEGLIDKGLAYEVEGNVFYDVEGFSGYGKLSGRSLDDMRAGERIEPHPGKRNPLDFALWKAAKEGEPSWSSPWGEGRPGWHIECSVMSTKYLEMGFDIHGGGSDLVFPHHENEVAQAEGLAGTEPFARYWLHAGMVQMESEKMSKSIGNVVLAHDIVSAFAGEVVRYWMLSGSYRSQAVFSDSSLNDSAQAYERWRTFVTSSQHLLADAMPERPQGPRRPVGEPAATSTGTIERFIEAMDDDFNSAEAFASLHELVRLGNKALEEAQTGGDAERETLTARVAEFLELTTVLGFEFPSEASTGESAELVAGLVDYLLALREEARAEKAFDRADSIRAKLTELGIAIEDTPGGTRWRAGAGKR